MSGELIAIVAVGAALAGLILTSSRGLRQDMAQLRRDMREDMGKLERVAPTFVLKYNIRTRSLADPGAIEDVLAVEDDVVPFDRADVLGAGLRQGLP